MQSHLCLEQAKKEGHETVTAGDIVEARRRFSEERITDLASEHQHKYRGIDRVVRKMAGWPKDFGPEKAGDLVLAVVDAIESTGEAVPFAWVKGYIDDPLGLMRILVELGVLKTKQSRTDKPRDWVPENPTEIDKNTWYSVHAMYAPALGCVGE